MHKEDSLREKSVSTSHRDSLFFIERLVPIVLFVVTLCTATISGVYLSGIKIELSMSIWKGATYAVGIIVATGSHAMGHYVVARLSGVKARLPCFIPTFGTIGTMGAYTKIDWPIDDRNKLIKIFIAGPIAGFFVSWIILIIGLFCSEIKEYSMITETDKIEYSLIVYITTLVFYGRIIETKDLLLHPIAYAGWIGLFYNFCHLLPIGKFDGGRLIYAVWGYQVAMVISFVSIGILFVLGYFLSDWTVWLGVAIVGAIFTFRSRRQYSFDHYSQPIENPILVAMILILIIFIVSFSPNPL